MREARPGGKTNQERSAKCDICTVHYGACAVDETLERITTILPSDFDTAGDRHTRLPGAIFQGGICAMQLTALDSYAATAAIMPYSVGSWLDSQSTQCAVRTSGFYKAGP